jgi:AmiR/NasT family two-component response regulator
MADNVRSTDEAFQLLIRTSQPENRKLRDIAAQIVSQTLQRPRLK